MLKLFSILLGAAYFFTLPWQPYPASYAIKGLSIALLAALAFSNRASILGVALALSALGDVLLDIDPKRLFVYGLAAFLCVHLIYVVLFVRNRRRPISVSAAQAILITLLLAYCALVSAWLFPTLGDLKIPVAIYMTAITAMVVTAVLARFPQRGVACGAILFLISDSLLAINKFKTPLPYRDFLVWATYYAGQYAIAAGFLSFTEKPRAAARGQTG